MAFQEFAACYMDRYAHGDYYIRDGKLGLLRCGFENGDDVQPCCCCCEFKLLIIKLKKKLKHSFKIYYFRIKVI